MKKIACLVLVGALLCPVAHAMEGMPVSEIEWPEEKKLTLGVHKTESAGILKRFYNLVAMPYRWLTSTMEISSKNIPSGKLTSKVKLVRFKDIYFDRVYGTAAFRMLEAIFKDATIVPTAVVSRWGKSEKEEDKKYLKWIKRLAGPFGIFTNASINTVHTLEFENCSGDMLGTKILWGVLRYSSYFLKNIIFTKCSLNSPFWNGIVYTINKNLDRSLDGVKITFNKCSGLDDRSFTRETKKEGTAKFQLERCGAVVVINE